MRILHIATRHRRGGAERNLSHTAEWELKQGHEVHLAMGRDSIDSEVPAGVTSHLVPELVRSLSPVQDVAAYRRLRRLIGQGRFDVIHTHQSKAGVVGRLAARGSGSAVVHTVHMASFGPAYGRIASAAFRAAERLCAPVTDRIVCVGTELRSMYLEAGIGTPDQYEVIRSPIEVAAFGAARAARATVGGVGRARASFGLDARAPVALVVASLEPRKRVDLIVDRLAARLRAGELTLAVAGDGRERVALRESCDRIGVGNAVRLLGHVDDVAALMVAGDVLVHAATVEGVPQVVIQALAAGLPVVATEMVGLREVEGAPIHVVPRAGDGLAEAVARAVAQRVQAVSLSALEPWTESAVDAGLARLHADLEARPRLAASER